MKMPCELTVTVVLPTARGELAKDLVKSHGYSQVQVSKLFGVTAAAISQYIKGVRGGNKYIDQSPMKNLFYAKISECATEISKGSSITDVLCEICDFSGEIGLIKNIAEQMGETTGKKKCECCPREVYRFQNSQGKCSESCFLPM